MKLNTSRKRVAMAMAAFATGIMVQSAQGTVIHFASGISSAGVPVTCRSELTMTGNLLVIQLFNDSVQSLNPNDVIGSYYFDVKNSFNVRPTLSYVSAVGDAWMGNMNLPDTLMTANMNLRALAAGDNTWQFKVMNAGLTPFMGFGVGTVGNSGVSPNNFMGNIVDGVDYSIYAGDVTTSNLNNKLLVKGPITFTFSGLTGFTEADISSNFACGLGTAPDSFMTPEPAMFTFLALGGLHFIRRRTR